ncbi:MAG: hypothetical protein ACPGNV_08490 [Mangrovicoccus sp.]
MLRSAAFLFATILALPAMAGEKRPITAAQFEAYVQGRTLTYAENGEVYGIEQYLPGRRVVWSFLNDDCVEGVWYESEGQICFLYQGDVGEQCWQFYASENGLGALTDGDDDSLFLYEVQHSSQNMTCPGPMVGV